MANPRKITPRWEEIFAALGDGLVVLDGSAEFYVIGMNPAAETITGFSAESTLGRPLRDAFPENKEVLQRLGKTFEEGGGVTLREVSWKRPRNRPAFVDLSATPLIGDEGDLDGWILVFRDITPVKVLEEEVRRSDRLAMMGTIAAGLAHEIKNPLGGIKGAAQLLSRGKLGAEAAELVSIVEKESERVDRLVSRLLVLTRPKAFHLEPLNINELLDSVLVLEKGPAEGRGIRLAREFDPSLPLIVGDDDELRQAFLNFIKNAIEAIADSDIPSGEVRVKTRMLNEFRIKEADAEKLSRMVVVEIQDDGPGIDPETLHKIFTPFFTTKNTGSGLGLVIAQRVIQEHGGTLRVRSEKGKGTHIQVSLRSAL